MKWPQIPRPWNPAYTETYDAMTEEERQSSFKIDLALVAVCLFVTEDCTECRGTGDCQYQHATCHTCGGKGWVFVEEDDRGEEDSGGKAGAETHGRRCTGVRQTT